MGTRRKLNIVVDAEYQGGQEIQAAENDIKGLDDASEKSSLSLGKLAQAGAAAGIAFAGVATVVKQTYSIINEGAEMAVAADKFDRLGESIGVTDDFLQKLREATGGTISDVNLMAGAVDLMALGFVKSEDQAVRLTKVVGALDMNMEALSLTISNETTARFDTLGISVDGFAKVLEETKAAGGSFTDALIIQSEKQIAIVGDSTDSQIGDMQRLEAAQENLVNKGKTWFAGQWAPIIGGVSDLLTVTETKTRNLDKALEVGIITQQQYNSYVNGGISAMTLYSKEIAEAESELETYNAETEKAIKEAADYLLYQRALSGELEDTSTAVTGLTLAQIYGAAAQEDANEAAKQSLRITAQNAAATIEDTKAREESTNALQEQRDAIQAVRDANELAIQAQEQHQAALGDYFTEAIGVVGTNQDLTISAMAQSSALYAAADAAGASGTELALLGLATGQLSEEQAEAALKSAALMAQIEGLGTAIAEGMDPQEALNRLQSFQENLDATDFSVRLGIEVEESTEKASDKTRETFDDFADKAETATDDAKTWFNSFADSAITNFDDVGISIDDLGEDFFKATTEAGKLKDMIIDGIPDEKIVTIKIRTEGSIPQGLGGGTGSTSATTTDVSRDIGH